MTDQQPDLAALAALAARMRASVADYRTLQPRVEAGAPWPLSDSFGTEPEAHWGPPETLAHVAEMLPFWTGEIERILDGDPEPVPFGRVATDPLRIGLIERDRTLPPRELFDRIDAEVDRLARRLATLDDAAARRRCVHPRLGEMTVAGLVDHFVASHLEDHAAQLRDGLGEG